MEFQIEVNTTTLNSETNQTMGDDNKATFNRFLEVVKKVTHNDAEVIALLEKRYAKANPSFTSSARFAKLVKNVQSKIEKDPENKFIFMKELSDELKAYDNKHINRKKGKKFGNPSDSDTSDVGSVVSLTREGHTPIGKDIPSEVETAAESTLESDKCAPSHQKCATGEEKEAADKIVFMDFSMPHGEETNRNQTKMDTNGIVIDLLSDNEGQMVQVPDEDAPASVNKTPKPPATAVVEQTESDQLDLVEEDSDFQEPGPSTSTAAADRAQCAKKQAKIKSYEVYLAKLDRRIKRLDEKEIAVDELDDDSTYLLIDKLKKKYVKHWKRLCELQGREKTTGRPSEKRFKCPTATTHPNINKRIEKFINTKGQFPDYGDLHAIVTNCNIRYKMKLSKNQVDMIARDAFTEVGNKLQRRRLDDFNLDPASHVLDHVRDLDDPALFDVELRRKLDSHQKQSKKNMNDILIKYTHMSRQMSQTAEEEEEEQMEEDEDEKEEEIIILEEKQLLSQISNVDVEVEEEETAKQGAIRKVSLEKVRAEAQSRLCAALDSSVCVESSDEGREIEIEQAQPSLPKTKDSTVKEDKLTDVPTTEPSIKDMLMELACTQQDGESENLEALVDRKTQDQGHDGATKTQHEKDVDLSTDSDSGVATARDKSASSEALSLASELGCFPLGPETEAAPGGGAPPSKKIRLDEERTFPSVERSLDSSEMLGSERRRRIIPVFPVDFTSDDHAQKVQETSAASNNCSTSNNLDLTPNSKHPFASGVASPSLREATTLMRRARTPKLSRKRKLSTDVVVIEDDRSDNEPFSTADCIQNTDENKTDTKKSDKSSSTKYSFKKVHTVVRTTSVTSDTVPQKETVVRGSYKTVIREPVSESSPGSVVSERMRKESTVTTSSHHHVGKVTSQAPAGLKMTGVHKGEKSAPAGFKLTKRKISKNPAAGLNVDLKVSESARKGVRDLAAKVTGFKSSSATGRGWKDDRSDQASARQQIKTESKSSVRAGVPAEDDPVIIVSDSD